MRKIIIITAVLAMAVSAVLATQDASLSQRDVRDPRRLETILQDNAADAESRLVSIESAIGTNSTDVTVTDAAVGGTLAVTGVATFTAAPVFVATNAAGTATVSATNAPTLVSTNDAAWVQITISGEVYVFPAYQLND